LREAKRSRSRGGVNEGSELLVCASVPDWLRYGAAAAGFAAFIVTRRSTLAGVGCGELV
jgi:hypothetical protein